MKNVPTDYTAYSSGEKICPRCGQIYRTRSAIARDGSGDICPDCGIFDALDSIGMGKTKQQEILMIVYEIMIEKEWKA